MRTKLDVINEVEMIIDKDYTQEELNSLSNKFRPIIHTWKDWFSPHLKEVDGKWVNPDWYDLFEEKHNRISELVFKIKTIGYY